MIYYINAVNLLFLLIFNNFIFSQSLPIKEQYDAIEDKLPNNLGLYKFINSTSSSNYPEFNGDSVPTYDALLGDRFADVFASFLTMYKTTGDKGYLHKFISQTYFVQQFRNDKQIGGVNPNKGWWQMTKNTERIYYDGVTIWPMAEYCFKIKYDPDFMAIANTPLPSCTSLDINCTIKWPSTNIVTYGDYANWLAERVHETLKWYIDNGYYSLQHGFKNNPFNIPQFNYPIQINQQAGFAASLFYIGAFYKNSNQNISNMYLQFSKKLAQKYKGIKLVYKKKNNNACVPSVQPVFQVYSQQTNAYTWHTNGWETHTVPNPLNDCYNEQNPRIATGYWEDISHGALSLVFPLAVYAYQQQFWGQTYFTQTDMQRFANTLTKLLYFNNNGKTDFYFSVNTGNNLCYICPDNLENGLPVAYNESNRRTALMWGNLDEHDLQNQQVYNLLLNYYAITLDGQNDNAAGKITEGNHYLGLSYLIQNQWQKECVNLSLYKRNMVYNQDFTVKNNISVEPNSNSIYNSPESYAEPKISTAEFTIEPGVTVNMLAGEEIHLADGFHAKAGSNFHAGINPNMCTDGGRVAGGNTGHDITLHEPLNINENLMGNEEVSIEKPKQQWLVFPNPAQQELNVLGSIDENVQLILLDMSGRTIWQHNFASTFYTADISALEQGIYILQISTSKQIQTEKIFVR